jgi:hypothetical protein
MENNRNTEESHDANLRRYQEKNLADNAFLLNKEIILSEVSLAQKTKNRMFSLICGH